MRRDAQVTWKYRRIYHEYLGDRNIGAVELPFHKDIITEPIQSLFEKMDLGQAVKDLLLLTDIYMPLCRIFTMNNKNYEGDWHRDDSKRPGNEITENIQVALFLEDQPGFRLIKKQYDIGGALEIIDNDVDEYIADNDARKSRKNFPLVIPNKYCDTISGAKGTVLFFDPSLLHQGHSRKRRSDFHFRFTNQHKVPYDKDLLTKNPFQDFLVTEEYGYDYDLKKGVTVPSGLEAKPTLYALYKTMNYFLPIKPLIVRAMNLEKTKNVPKPLEISYFYNTFFK